MDELPAIFATVSGIEVADVEIGWRDPMGIEEGELPRVLVFNPETDEPEPPEFGLRFLEYSYTVVLVNDVDTDEASFQLCEEMANALTAAALTNADTAYMNPGSIVIAEQTQRSIVGMVLVARYEGL
jgi:hypothetical protein